MSNQRFQWERESALSCCIELRARNHVATLTKDSGLKCLVPGCGHTCDERDVVYKPAHAPNTTTNRTMAHKECVDKFIAESKGEQKKESRRSELKKAEARGVLPAAEAKPVVVGVDIKAYIQKIKEAAYLKGIEDGRRSVLTELAALGDDELQELGH